MPNGSGRAGRRNAPSLKAVTMSLSEDVVRLAKRAVVDLGDVGVMTSVSGLTEAALRELLGRRDWVVAVKRHNPAARRRPWSPG